jgi:hypothetical protein
MSWGRFRVRFLVPSSKFPLRRGMGARRGKNGASTTELGTWNWELGRYAALSFTRTISVPNSLITRSCPSRSSAARMCLQIRSRHR